MPAQETWLISWTRLFLCTWPSAFQFYCLITVGAAFSETYQLSWLCPLSFPEGNLNMGTQVIPVREVKSQKEPLNTVFPVSHLGEYCSLCWPNVWVLQWRMEARASVLFMNNKDTKIWARSKKLHSECCDYSKGTMKEKTDSPLRGLLSYMACLLFLPFTCSEQYDILRDISWDKETFSLTIPILGEKNKSEIWGLKWMGRKH